MDAINSVLSILLFATSLVTAYAIGLYAGAKKMGEEIIRFIDENEE